MSYVHMVVGLGLLFSVSLAYSQPSPARTETRFAEQSRIGRYSVLYPPDYSPDTTYQLIVLFHGNGHGTDVMIEWAKSLDIRDAIIICPEAPYLRWQESLTSRKQSFTGMSDVIGAPDSLRSRTVQLTAEWYRSAIGNAQRELPVSLHRPMVIGFSQGGFYALVYATRFPDEVSTVVTICASTYPEGDLEKRYEALRDRGIEVLLTHGRHDKTVPFSVGNDHSLALAKAGVRHSLVPFDGGHETTDVITRRIKEWILSHRLERTTEPVQRNGRR